MKTAAGLMPVMELLAAGVPVGLGTDGAASNNNQDMFEEMDLAAKQQKFARMDPKALSALQAVEMATITGARALHLERQIGSLEVGKKADLIVVDTTAPHATPLYNVYSAIVYSLKSSDVRTTIIAGKPRDGRSPHAHSWTSPQSWPKPRNTPPRSKCSPPKSKRTAQDETDPSGCPTLAPAYVGR